MTFLVLYLLYAFTLSIALARAGHRSQGGARETEPRPAPTRVLIFGASGRTGRQLVEQALERGYSVTAFVRERSRLTTEHPRLTVVEGDVLGADTVDAAMRGQDAAISALGHRRYFGPTRILSQGTRNILRAMEKHGARRFVCQTSMGIGDSAGRMGLYYTLFVIPVVLPFYFWDKTRQERAVAQSRVDWVIVRPGVLNGRERRGHVRHGLKVGNYLWTVRISLPDVAAFMLDQLETDTYLGTAPGVCW